MSTPKIIGIGGVFFKSEAPEKLKSGMRNTSAWY